MRAVTSYGFFVCQLVNWFHFQLLSLSVCVPISWTGSWLADLLLSLPIHLKSVRLSLRTRFSHSRMFGAGIMKCASKKLAKPADKRPNPIINC